MLTSSGKNGVGLGESDLHKSQDLLFLCYREYCRLHISPVVSSPLVNTGTATQPVCTQLSMRWEIWVRTPIMITIFFIYTNSLSNILLGDITRESRAYVQWG